MEHVLRVKAVEGEVLKTMALAAAAHVEGGSFRVVTLDHHGTITVRGAYQDRRVAHGQQTKLSNHTQMNVYVLTRRGAEVTVWNGPGSRILRIEAAGPAGRPNLERVRDLQKLAKRLRGVFLRPRDGRAGVREAVKYANDCGCSNPRPGSDEAAQERWAGRWLARYEAKRREILTGETVASA